MFPGAALHIIGDGFTIEAVPVLWPRNPTQMDLTETVFFKGNGTLRCPHRPVARGSWREGVLSIPVALDRVIALGQLALQIVPSLDELKVRVRGL